MTNYHKILNINNNLSKNNIFYLSGDGNILFSIEKKTNQYYIISRKINNNTYTQIGNKIPIILENYSLLDISIVSNYNGSVFVFTYNNIIQVYKLLNNNWITYGNTLETPTYTTTYDTILNNIGNILLITSYNSNQNSFLSVYIWNTDKWILKGTNIKLDKNTKFTQGFTMSDDGNTLIVSSPKKNRIKIYTYEDSDYENIQIINNSNINEVFGQKIVCNNDATIIAVITPIYEQNIKKVYFYTKDNNQYFLNQELFIDDYKLSDITIYNQIVNMSNSGNIFILSYTSYISTSNEYVNKLKIYKLNNENIYENKYYKDILISTLNKSIYMYYSISNNGNKLAINNCNSGIDIYELQLTKEELLEKEVEKLKNIIEEKNKIITQNDVTINTLMLDLDDAKKNVLFIKNTLDCTKLNNTAINNELTSTKSQLKTNNSNLITLQKNLDSTKAILITTQDKLTITTTKYENTREELTSYKSIIENVKNDLNTTKSDLQLTKTHLTNTINTLNITKNNLELTTNTLNKTENELYTTKNTLKNTQNELKKNNDILTNTNNELNNKNILLEDKIHEIKLIRNTLNEFKVLLNN